MKRRDFLKYFAASAAGAGILGLGRFKLTDKNNSRAGASGEELKEAYYYRSKAGDEVECELCFRGCNIPEGGSGFCRIRVNRNGTLYSQVYGRPSAVMADPIEKEPMHHFKPGSRILCIGTASCNFRCKFCHNYHLSQRDIDEVNRVQDLSPKEAVSQAKDRGLPSMSFTYNEPTIFYEYMYDIAELAQEEDINIIFHTNGGLRREPLQDLLKNIDAVTVDLKAFTDEFYRDICQAELETVLESLQIIYEAGAWLEIVNLVLPDHNDNPEEIREMTAWIRDELGAEVPLHFSRFMPSYQMTDLSPTPVETLEECHKIAVDQGLKYVSIGNVPGHRANSSFCPECGERIIDRHHFTVNAVHIDEGRCSFCGAEISGVWR